MVWVLHQYYNNSKANNQEAQTLFFSLNVFYMMNIDNLFFYINLLNGGLCEDAINLCSCSFIHIFFLLILLFFPVHEICISRNHSNFTIFFCICVLYYRNDNVEYTIWYSWSSMVWLKRWRTILMNKIDQHAMQISNI
jgi:hypothetical protein